MALFKVRPSRGSWAFFVVIAVAAVSRRQWGKHEAQVIRRDGPAVESARALATCLLGPNVSWILRDEDDPPPGQSPPATPRPPLTPPERQARWAERLGSWLLPHAAGAADHGWPSRCVAPLDELDHRLQLSSQRTPQLSRNLGTVRGMLRRSRVDLLGAVDDPTDASLPRQLAQIFTDVRELSLGTRDRWTPTPLRADQYPMPPEDPVPRWRPVHPAQEQTVLASPTVYFYRSSWDGRTHRVDFDRNSRSDTEVGAAVLWREPARGGVLRASTERGGAVIPMEPATRVVALPDEPGVTRHGDYFDWQSATSADGMVWVTNANGTVRLRARRWDDAGWGEPVALGFPQSPVAVVVAPEPLDDRRWRVTTVRPRAVDRMVEQHVVTTAGGAAPTVAPGARPEVVRLPEVLRTMTCGSEAVRYVALLGPLKEQRRDDPRTPVAVVRVEGAQVRVWQDELAGQWGAEPTLRCDAGRALLASDRDPAVEARAAVVTFPVAGAPSVERVTALPYDRVGRLRELLLVDDGLVALSANTSALRAWRLPLHETRWEPGGFVAALTLSAEVTRAVRSMRAVSQGRSLAVWIEGDAVTRRTVVVPPTESGGEPTRRTSESRAPFRVLMMSDDSGRTFAGL